MNLLRSASLVVVLLYVGAAFGHGFGLSLSGNRIDAETEIPTLSPHLFTETFDAFNAATMFSDHGGVEADAGSGFNLPSDTLSVEFLGPLWFSSGGAAQRAPAGLTLNATSYDSFGAVMGSPVNITGASNSPGSFPIVGNDDHSIGWILSGTSSIPSGIYGFGYRVTGLKDGNETTPFKASVPLVVAFSTPDFIGGSSATVSDAERAIFNAVLQGDFDRDGKPTSADLAPLLAALTDLATYQSALDLPDSDLMAIADLDRDGVITNADIQPMLDLLGSPSGGPQSVPEPAAAILLIAGLSTILTLKRWQT